MKKTPLHITTANEVFSRMADSLVDLTPTKPSRSSAAERAMTDITQAAAKFVMWALLEGSWHGRDIDGGEAQDKAVELGLIVPTIYDPKKHGEGANCRPGDHWFVPSEALLSTLSPADGGGQS